MIPSDTQLTRYQSNDSRFRHAGIAIAGSTLLGLLAVSLHPVVSNAHSPQESLNQIAAFAAHDAIVHGTLIALLAVIAAGFVAFGDMLGAHRIAVRFGKTGYLTGFAAMTAAMLLDGFAVPMFGKKLATTSATDVQTAFVVLQAIGVFIQVLTKAGIVAVSTAFLAFAYALHSQAHTSSLVWVRRCA
jgi:hypothetical protein